MFLGTDYTDYTEACAFVLFMENPCNPCNPCLKNIGASLHYKSVPSTTKDKKYGSTRSFKYDFIDSPQLFQPSRNVGAIQKSRLRHSHHGAQERHP